MGGLRFGVIRSYWVLYWVWFDWIGFGSWRRYVLYWVQLNDCLDISFKLPNCENLVSNEKKTRHDYLHLFPGISHQPRQPDPRAEQMERRTVAHSHLLGYSMIHMATDDGYSTLSHSGQHQTHTHTHGWMTRWVPAGIRPTWSIRHASLSETAVLNLISRSDVGLSFTVRALAHPSIFTQQSYSQWSTLSQRQLINNTHFTWSSITPLAPHSHLQWLGLCVTISHEMCWAGHTFAKCLRHNEEDYMTAHLKAITAWEKWNLSLYCVPCVLTSVACVRMWAAPTAA